MSVEDNLSLDLNNINWVECTLGDIVTLKEDMIYLKITNKGKYLFVVYMGLLVFHDEFTTDFRGLQYDVVEMWGKYLLLKKLYWSHNTIYLLKNLKCGSIFVYYHLKRIDLKQFAGGSVVPTLNRSHIHLIGIRIPVEIIEQKKIVLYY